MNIKYFQDTDTLNIQSTQGILAETRDLDERGQVVAISWNLRGTGPTSLIFPTRSCRPDTSR